MGRLLQIRVREITGLALRAVTQDPAFDCSIPELLARVENGDMGAWKAWRDRAREIRERLKR
jgi:hypothetical protein